MSGMTDLIAATALVIDSKIRLARTVVTGLVTAVTRTTRGEVDVDIDLGIGKRDANGEPSADGQVTDAPVAYPGGGGFSMRWPLTADDEVIGLVSDRPTGVWRQNKSPGESSVYAEHHHDVSDTIVLPMRLTPPEENPTNETTDLIIVGPTGEAFRLGDDGKVTITKAGLVLATITMEASGSIVIEVATGQTVKLGDASAEPLVIASALMSAMTAMLNAGVATPPSPLAGNNGSLAFTAGQTAWNAAIGGTPLGTIKAFGV